jgi:PleD family two-component response regulator
LYQLVSGKPPLDETRERMKRLAAHRFTDVPPVTKYIPTLSHRVVILIGRMMDLDADKRIQTPAQAVQELEAAIAAIEAGDNQQYDAELSEKQNQQYRDKLLEKEEGLDRTVMLLESNKKVQDSLRERLKSVGYRVLIIADPARAMSRFEDLDATDDSPVDCIIVGCAGDGRKGLDVFLKVITHEFTKKIPAVLIVPEGLLKQVPADWINQNRALMTLPLRMQRLRKELKRLINADRQSHVDDGSEADSYVDNMADSRNTDSDFEFD